MLDYILYLWIGFFVLSVIAELITMNLIAIWFMPGTIIAIVLALFSIPVWIQVLVWFCTTIIVFLATGGITRRFLNRRAEATNADRVVGKEAIVTETISDREQTGQAKVLGQIWSARCTDPDAVIDVGTQVRVVRIEGVKIIVSVI